MTDLAERRKSGIPDPPHEYGIYCARLYSNEQKDLILEAFNDERFRNCATYQQQICVLYDLLHNERGDLMVKPDLIGLLFKPQVSARAITKRIEREPKSIGRPHILTDEEVEIIKNEMDRICIDAFPTISDIADFIAKRFNKFPSMQTVRNLFIKKRITTYLLSHYATS